MAAEEAPEHNPFSFREFVRSKAARPGLSLGSFPLPHPAALAEARDEEEEEDEEEEQGWSGAYLPAAVERAQLGPAGSAGLPSLAAPPAPRQPSYRELKEENASLRSKIYKLQIFSETQADKMRKLERKLEENQIKEEKEARDLEAMVQHVEQNLQLMTKRAVRAESSATKLKQENALLQVQLKNCQAENEALRGQSASLAAVKQNTDLALQNLLTVISSSRSSIRQLLSGAESLELVADLLRCTDRVSEVPAEGP
ncbi:endosome-associated-trafficking regulator 1 [Apus apus]|uniref:endosome-associated-trafficking regulator 1 n=1 Tax=Apus apus TaxID=8895 RepID=UPI0021F8A6BD|nr:endosome-associated-trafficking regulator 1 [Apus apus]